MRAREGWSDDLVEAVAAVAGETPGAPCPPESSWVALLSGEVGEEEAERLRAHLAGCPACVETARDAGRFVAAMGDLTRLPRARSSLRPWLVSAAAAILVGACALVAVRGMRPEVDPLAPWSRGQVSPPAAPPGSVDGELVFRGGEAASATDLDRALAPYRAGDWDLAERALADHLAAHPSDVRAALYRGAALVAAGRAAEARAPLAAAAAGSDPAVAAEARWYLALASLRAGDRSAAAEALVPLRGRDGPHAAEVEALAAALERAR